MSRQLALDIVNLQPTDRIGHTEYSMEYHADYAAARTGIPKGAQGLWTRFYDLWQYDFVWSTDNGLHGNWGKRGRATNMGHAVYAADGSDQVGAAPSPFTTPDEVWAFDAVEEYGLPDFDEQVAAYQKGHENNLSNSPDRLVTGGYYNTLISGALNSFGWDMLLMAASEPAKFEKTLDSFFRFTLHHMQAWARTDVEVVIQHDDFVWTSGAFMNPDFYRQAIIPRYAELWKPIHEAGKKVLFCSDGLFLEFMDDVAEAGADGFIFEPCNDFAEVATRFGSSHCLVGSGVDCRTMTFGNWSQVKAEMDRTFKHAGLCKGLIWAVGNHIPHNVSDDMCDRYIDELLPRLKR